MTLGDFRELHNSTLKGLIDFSNYLSAPHEMSDIEHERMKEAHLKGQEYLEMLEGIVANWGR